jgi:hypothetical protein
MVQKRKRKTTSKKKKASTPGRAPTASVARRTSKAKKPREYIRFPADPGDYALIDAKAKARKFDPHMAALIVEESYKGCSLVILKTQFLHVGEYCRISVGKVGVFVGQVKWRKELAPRVHQIGLEYVQNYEGD